MSDYSATVYIILILATLLCIWGFREEVRCKLGNVNACQEMGQTK